MENDSIQTNSQTMLINEATSRFSGAEWFSKIQEQSIVLAGLGGIGSYVAFLLARVRPNFIAIYDDDIVEEGNLSGQLYSTRQVGKSKCNSTIENCRFFGNYRGVFGYNTRFDSSSSPAPIMICGFDNMAARRTFFGRWERYINEIDPSLKSDCLFIDGRLAMEEFQILAFTGDNDAAISKYKEEWLFGDSEAEAHVCSRKQTTFTANMIASVMVNIFVNHVANLCNPIVPRDVPFLTRYDASLMYFKTENV